MAEEQLSAAEAAKYLGMTRQALTAAAERGDVGRKVDVIGRNPPYVYRFTRSELDQWVTRSGRKSGRPKNYNLIPTPVIRAAA
jgi:hypothetical protein